MQTTELMSWLVSGSVFFPSASNLLINCSFTNRGPGCISRFFLGIFIRTWRFYSLISDNSNHIIRTCHRWRLCCLSAHRGVSIMRPWEGWGLAVSWILVIEAIGQLIPCPLHLLSLSMWGILPTFLGPSSLPSPSTGQLSRGSLSGITTEQRLIRW